MRAQTPAERQAALRERRRVEKYAPREAGRYSVEVASANLALLDLCRAKLVYAAAHLPLTRLGLMQRILSIQADLDTVEQFLYADGEDGVRYWPVINWTPSSRSAAVAVRRLDHDQRALASQLRDMKTLLAHVYVGRDDSEKED